MHAGKTEEQPEQWGVPRSQASSPRLQQRSESPSLNRLWQHACLLSSPPYSSSLSQPLSVASSWQASSETQSLRAILAFPTTSRLPCSCQPPVLMCLQLPPKASAALSALIMVPRPPNPFPEVQEPHVAVFCSVHPVSMGNWCPEKGHHFQKFPLSHSYPAAQPGINPQFHDPGILPQAVHPQGFELPPCQSMYIDGRWGWFIALFYLLVSSTTKFPQQSPLPPYHGHSW